MLNPIQRTSNYQNSRPNFGMAIESKLVDAMYEYAGTDLKLTREVTELVKRAADNKLIHVVLNKPGRDERLRTSLILDDYFSKTKIPCADSTQIATKDETIINLVRKQIIDAEARELDELPRIGQNLAIEL